jgi:hypothetical protein
MGIVARWIERLLPVLVALLMSLFANRFLLLIAGGFASNFRRIRDSIRTEVSTNMPARDVKEGLVGDLREPRTPCLLFWHSTVRGTLPTYWSAQHDWAWSLLRKRLSAPSLLLEINNERAEQAKIQSTSDFFQKEL